MRLESQQEELVNTLKRIYRGTENRVYQQQSTESENITATIQELLEIFRHNCPPPTDQRIALEDKDLLQNDMASLLQIRNHQALNPDDSNICDPDISEMLQNLPNMLPTDQAANFYGIIGGFDFRLFDYRG